MNLSCNPESYTHLPKGHCSRTIMGFYGHFEPLSGKAISFSLHYCIAREVANLVTAYLIKLVKKYLKYVRKKTIKSKLNKKGGFKSQFLVSFNPGWVSLNFYIQLKIIIIIIIIIIKTFTGHSHMLGYVHHGVNYPSIISEAFHRPQLRHL